MNASPSMTAVDASVTRAATDIQMLVFVVGKEQFAVPLTEIQEIMKTIPLTPVPHAPESVRGIVNIRGKVATAVDLPTVLGFAEASTAEYMIMATYEKNFFALLVDGIVGVLRTSTEHMRTTPDLFGSKATAAYIKGALVIPKSDAKNEENHATTAKLDDSDIILALNLPTIFSAVAASTAR